MKSVWGSEGICSSKSHQTQKHPANGLISLRHADSSALRSRPLSARRETAPRAEQSGEHDVDFKRCKDAGGATSAWLLLQTQPDERGCVEMTSICSPLMRGGSGASDVHSKAVRTEGPRRRARYTRDAVKLRLF